MGELWYQNVAYEDKKELVKENLANTVTSFIAAGYWLKDIRDSKGYLKDGYQSVWECAEAEFGLKVSEASRAMSMNDKYSIDGNTPFMNDTYKEYNKSQLQEMLTLSDEQMEQVTPDMTVTAIRKMKNPVPEQKEQQEKLDSWVKAFVADEYMNLLRFYNMAAGFGVEQLKGAYAEGMQVNDYVLLLGDADSELIDEETGEIVGKYSSQTVVNVLTACFLESRQQKSEKMLPEIKGLMDDPYCRACGCPLNSPDDGCQSTICPECGQAVDWSKWIKSCDIATDLVMTECEEEFEDEIITDIEVLP